MKIQIHESQPTEAAPEWPKVRKSKDRPAIYIFRGPDTGAIVFENWGLFHNDSVRPDNMFLTPLTGPVTITITP